MPNQPRPGYRTWYHRVRSRAVNQLIRFHRDEFLTILGDEKRADPFEDAQCSAS